MPENDERISSRRSALGYALMPMALVPLLALLTYNWRAVGFLQTPPEKCTNLFGMLGNYFAYYGYTLVEVCHIYYNRHQIHIHYQNYIH